MQHTTHRRGVIESVAISLAGALLLGCIAFLVFPRTAVSTIFIGPGIAVMGVFAHVVPESVVYGLQARGAAPSFFAVAFTLAVAFWTCVFAACIAGWRRLHGTRTV